MAVERIDLINDQKTYNKLMINLGYMSPHLIRDIEILQGFYYLYNKGIRPLGDIYDVLGVKHRLEKDTIRKIVVKLKREIE